MIFCKEFLLSKIFNFRIKLYFLIKQLYFFTASPQPVPDGVILFSRVAGLKGEEKWRGDWGEKEKETTSFCSFILPLTSVETEMSYVSNP